MALRLAESRYLSDATPTQGEDEQSRSQINQFALRHVHPLTHRSYLSELFTQTCTASWAAEAKEEGLMPTVDSNLFLFEQFPYFQPSLHCSLVKW